MEYEVLPRVDEFCRVDGVEFDFVHIPCVELSLPSGILELYHNAKCSNKLSELSISIKMEEGEYGAGGG